MASTLPYPALEDALIRNTRARIQTLIGGPPAVGKSALVESVAAHTQHDLITMYPALWESPDVKGYLLPGPDGPRFHAVGELRRALSSTRPTVLFLDELGQASEDVQKACMSLVWARCVDGVRLPDHVVIHAATNRVEDAGCGSMRLNPALFTRFHCYIELITDAAAWLAWAASAGVDPLLCYLVSQHPELLTSPQPKGAGAYYDRWSSPRTLALASDLIKAGHPLPTLAALLRGCIGTAAADLYIQIREVLSNCPPPAQVFADPHNCPVPEPTYLQTFLSAVAGQATAAGMTAIEAYSNRLPQEFTPYLWKRIPATLHSHPVYIAAATRELNA